MKNNLATTSLILTMTFVLASCNKAGPVINQNNNQVQNHTVHEGNETDHQAMNHSSDGSIPEHLKVASDSLFKVGDVVYIDAEHMAGMNGAEATIVGAFDTVAYEVSYESIADHSKVKHHRWVIHEEIENATEQPYAAGDFVKLHAEHMAGMDGATATIDRAISTTVYMVDYTSDNGDVVKNHKWLIEDELVE